MSIAIVTPVHADGAAVAGLLATVAAWPTPPDEFVLVCSEVDPALEALARSRGAAVLAAPANRGAQLDVGARAARADVLWFLHASASPAADSLRAIEAAIAAGAESGCFRFEFAGRPSFRKHLIAALTNLRVALGGIAYGDQGLFVRADAYVASGGFPRQPLFEEVRLVRRLRRRGTFRVLAATIGVSPRRFERDGFIRRALRNRWLALCYMVGVPAERLARRYRQASATETGP